MGDPTALAGSSGEVLLVVNADDFGLSRGINRGVVDAHLRGIVTSTSLVVGAPRAEEAAEMSRECPDLSVGLHFTGTDEEGQPVLDLGNPELVTSELQRQIDAFTDLVGSHPSHLDSHHHVHGRRAIRGVFEEASRRQGIPLRRSGTVTYHGFYAQWKWGLTDLNHISVEFLQGLLGELAPGAHEIGCHPGYVTDDFDSIYHAEREAEVATLTDPRMKRTIDELQIRLVNYRTLAEVVSTEGAVR